MITSFKVLYVSGIQPTGLLEYGYLNVCQHRETSVAMFGLDRISHSRGEHIYHL